MEFHGVFIADWIWISVAVICGLSILSIMVSTRSGNVEINVFTLLGTYSALWVIMKVLIAAHLNYLDWTRDLYRFVEHSWVPDYWLIPAEWASRFIQISQGWKGLVADLAMPILFFGGWVLSWLIGPGIFFALALWVHYKEDQQAS